MRIEIVAGRKEEFIDRITKLSKKIKKEIKFEDLGIVERSISIKDDGEESYIDVSFASFEVDIEEHLQYNVNGFTFFAMVKDDGENPMVISPDKEAFKRLNLDRVFECPHCHRTIQNRKNKVFLQKDGELFAFGSKCATEYFGESFKFLTKNLGFFEGFEEDMLGFSMVNKNNIEKFYLTVAASIQAFKNGVELKKMIEGRPSLGGYPEEIKAKDIINENLEGYFFLRSTLNNPDTKPEIKKRYEEMKIQFDNIIGGDDFKNIIEHYKNAEPTDNFGFNVKNQFNNQGNVAGILVYGVYKYFWDEAKKNAAKLEPKEYNRFPGAVGEKISNVKVKLSRFNSFETDFGTKFVYSFLTDNAENITVFSMGQLPVHCGYDNMSDFKEIHADIKKREDGQEFREIKFEVGLEFVILKGVIKDQKEYKGIPQTTIKLGRMKNIIASK